MKLYFYQTWKNRMESRKCVSKEPAEILHCWRHPLMSSSAWANVQFDKIYSSDLPRAYRSAEIIQSENQYQTLLFQLSTREWALGKLEGAKYFTVEGTYHSADAGLSYDLSRLITSYLMQGIRRQTTNRTVPS